MIRHITQNEKNTMQIGQTYAHNLKGGEIICLRGDLGSGKTTFTKGMAKGLGIKNRLLSPTFIIVRQYEIQNKPFKFLYHLDLYRFTKANEVKEIGFDEYINKKENIVVIEWPEKLGELLPQKRIDIFFNNLGNDKREIKINELI